ncbi:hypothetical protein SAMN04487830_13826 [Pseudobutyrivibrio sp. OR37]|nr:hypothetical protein SAMN04487830_13826 [Pseudobutyrivibrio sp. OR37]
MPTVWMSFIMAQPEYRASARVYGGEMKYCKWMNLIPLVLFIIRDMLGMAGINPIWLLVAVALAIMNVFMAKSMREYLLASLLLLLSCVVGMILNTYYYYS